MPRFDLGGAFRGASRGLGTVLDVLQYNERQKLGEAQRTREEEEAKRARELDAFMLANTVNAQGGQVEEPGVQGAPMFQSRMGPVGQPTKRPVTMQDLLTSEGMGRVRVDPSQSVAAKLQREKDARELTARQALANVAPEEERPAILGGADPQDVRSMRPPAVPRPPQTPWEKDGFQDERSWLAFRGREAAATRAPQQGGGGKTLPAAQIEKLAMFTDLENTARSIPMLIDQEKGNIGTGPIIGKMPRFVRDMASGASGKINARAVISSIAGQYMNLISGAAVSPSEAARLAPFVPDGRDDEQTIRYKAVAFANRLRQIGAAKRAAFRAAGYRMDEGGEEPPENEFEDLVPVRR